MSVTIKKVDGQSITIIIPASGETGWSQIVKDAFKALSEHTHTGSGTGAQLSSSALQDESVKATKIHSDVAGTALSKNNTSKALDVQVDDSSIEIHTDNNLRLKDDGITQAKLHPDLDTLVNKITPNETNIATNAANITSNDTDIAANTSSIAALTVNDLANVSASTPTSGQVLSWNSSANEWRNTEPTGGSGSGGGGTGIITDWQAYTPTLTNITLGNGIQEWTYRRVGSDIEITGNVSLGSTSSVSGVMEFSLPSGLSTDLGAYADVNNSQIVTYGHANVVTGSGNLGRYDVKTNGSSTTNFIITGTRHDGVSGDWDSSFPLNSWGVGHQFNVRMTVPISSWVTGTTSVDTGELPTIFTLEGLTSEQAVNRVTNGGETLITNWNTPVTDTKSAWDSTNNEYVIPSTGYYDIHLSTYIYDDDSTDGNNMNSVQALILKEEPGQSASIFRRDFAGAHGVVGTGTSGTAVAQITAIGVHLNQGDKISFATDYSGGDQENELRVLEDLTHASIAKRETVQTTVINAPETVSLYATLSTDQTVSTSTTNKVELDGVVEDTSNNWVNSTDSTDSNGYYLIPSTGYYFISAQVGTDDVGNTDILYCLITKNGLSDIVARGANRAGSHSSTDVEFAQTSGVYKFDKGDKVFLCVDVFADTSYITIDTGNARDTFLNIHKLESGTTIYPEPVESTPVACQAFVNADYTRSDDNSHTILFNETVFDTHSGFDTSTGVYTFPESGYYLIHANVILEDFSGFSNARITDGVSSHARTYFGANDDDGAATSFSYMNYYTQGDTTRVYVDPTGVTEDASYTVAGNTTVGAGGMPTTNMSIVKLEGGTTIYPEPANVKVNADLTSAVTLSASSGTETTIIFNNEEIDNSVSYNNTTGEFTVPSSGRYLITAQVDTTGLSDWAEGDFLKIGIEKNGVGRHYERIVEVQEVPSQAVVLAPNLVVADDFVTGDTLKVNIDAKYGGSGTLQSTGGYLSITKLV